MPVSAPARKPIPGARDREVYTPQVVVNGSAHVIGSDRAGIESAIDITKKTDGVMSVPVTMTQSGKQINVSVAASSKGPAALHGEVWICSVSKEIPIAIGRGENRGREVTYHNVVRNLLKVGTGTELPQLDRALENISGRASMPRWFMSRTAVATSRVRCWERPTRRCTEFSHSSSRWTRLRAERKSRNYRSEIAGSHWRRNDDGCRRRHIAQGRTNTRTPKRKRTNSRWPSMGITTCEQARS